MDEDDAEFSRAAFAEYERDRAESLGDLVDEGDDDNQADYGEDDGLGVAPHPDVNMPTPQDAMPNEIDGEPVVKRTLVVPNSV
eukprot:2065908-Karenia_brevis.AAC.1